MPNICLYEMTRPLCHAYLREFTHDPDLFMADQPFVAYVYTQEKADAYWQRHRDLCRVHLAVMLDAEPIGEIILKNIQRDTGECTMGISMKNDHFKNRGYGTAAEKLALTFAFNEMGMQTIFADALLKNARSRHVLEKVGFRQIRQDDTFCYYRCDKTQWQGLNKAISAVSYKCDLRDRQ